MPLLISETYINETKHEQFGDSDPYEPFTEDIGELYQHCMKEFGRCTGYVFVDGADGKSKKVGWVFRKKMLYEDARSVKDSYIRSVWVTLHDAPTEVKRIIHYHELTKGGKK